jgi:hypothetical protein
LSVIYDRPIRELLVEGVAAMPPTFRRKQVHDWFEEHYPLVARGSVDAHITAATVNSRCRHYYSGAVQDLIFKRSDGWLERYDEIRHGEWDLYGNLIPGTAVDSEAAAGTVQQVRDELRRDREESQLVPGLRATDRVGRLTNWQLILAAACALTAAGNTPFSRIDVFEWIWERFPRSEHERGALDPTFQGMIDMATRAPRSPCGTPFRRVARGLHELIDPAICDGIGNTLNTPSGDGSDQSDSSADLNRSRSRSRSPRSRTPGQSEVRRRLDSLIDEFDQCVETYDRLVPFTRSGQYEFHRRTIDRRTTVGSVEAAVHDVEFLELLYGTLQHWGIGRRASRLVPLTEFRSTLESHLSQLAELEPLTIESITGIVQSTLTAIDFLISDLSIVDNRARIVAGTKTLHHLLPNLVPPMDRAWTGAFFGWSTLDPQNNQTVILREAFNAFVEVASVKHPSRLVGAGWRTSSTKVLDNAVIGYCKLHGLGGSAT